MLQKTEPLTIDHPLVQQAKAKWDAWHTANRASKHGKHFRYFFERFNADDASFGAIAKKIGLKRQGVCEIYDRFFSGLFGGRSGHERFQSVRQKRTLKKRLAHESSLLSKSPLREIARRARAHGCVVEGLPLAKNDGKVARAFLRVNGRTCLVRHAKSIFMLHGTNPYLRFSLSPNSVREAEFAILYADTENYGEPVFVIPTPVLCKAHYRKPGEGSKSVYIPAQNVVPGNFSAPLVEYWDYLDAWHLVRPKKGKKKSNPPQ